MESRIFTPVDTVSMARTEAALDAEDLVERAKAGSQDSFEALVALYERRVYNFLYQLARNQHDAEDLVQDTFVKVYQNLHRFDPKYSFATWLFTIAKRTAYNHFRAKRPMEEMDVNYEWDREDPAAVLAKEDARKSLWNQARKLKPSQFQVLWLHYGEGFSVAETARIMETNLIRVKVLLHRGRKELAKFLGENFRAREAM